MGNYIFSEFELALRRLAETDDGKLVLQHLKKHKMDRGCMPPEVGDGVGTALVMAFKDGEGNVVRELFRIIEREVS